MPSSVYFSNSHRATGYKEKSNGLPTHSSAIQEKFSRHSRSPTWIVPISLPIPGVRTRRLRLLLPNPFRLHQLSVARFGRKRGSLVLCFGVLVLLFTTFIFAKRFGTQDKSWTPFPMDPPTLVFKREDLQRIWKWEIASGHYPSRRSSG